MSEVNPDVEEVRVLRAGVRRRHEDARARLAGDDDPPDERGEEERARRVHASEA
jgi:hypothetical protein